MRMIYMIAAAVLRGLGWEVEINEKDSYWNLVLTNTTSSENMPESHKSCLRGLLRGWLMEFNFEGGRQQVNIYKELHGLDPEDDRYSCLDTCVKRTDSNTPQYKLNDKEVFVRRKDRFDRYVLEEPVSENITTRLSTEQGAATRANGGLMLDDELDSHKPKDKKMKANDAPEKLYLLPNEFISYCRNCDEDIEYTRTDALIEKACEWIETNMDDYIHVEYDTVTGKPTDEAHIAHKKVVEDFRKYLKGE